MSKMCSKCRKVLPDTQFYKRGGARGGRHTYCKRCTNAHVKEFYASDPQKLRRRNDVRAGTIRQLIDGVRKAGSCSTCGDGRWYVLDFHHRDAAAKSFEISQATYRYGKPAVLAEIEKCDLLCANCHRELHHFKRQTEM